MMTANNHISPRSLTFKLQIAICIVDKEAICIVDKEAKMKRIPLRKQRLEKILVNKARWWIMSMWTNQAKDV